MPTTGQVKTHGERLKKKKKKLIIIRWDREVSFLKNCNLSTTAKKCFLKSDWYLEHIRVELLKGRMNDDEWLQMLNISICLTTVVFCLVVVSNAYRLYLQISHLSKITTSCLLISDVSWGWAASDRTVTEQDSLGPNALSHFMSYFF